MLFGTSDRRREGERDILGLLDRETRRGLFVIFLFIFYFLFGPSDGRRENGREGPLGRDMV